MRFLKVMKFSTAPNLVEYWSKEAPQHSETGTPIAKGDKVVFTTGCAALFVRYDGPDECGPDSNWKHKYTPCEGNLEFDAEATMP